MSWRVPGRHGELVCLLFDGLNGIAHIGVQASMAALAERGEVGPPVGASRRQRNDMMHLQVTHNPAVPAREPVPLKDGCSHAIPVDGVPPRVGDGTERHDEVPPEQSQRCASQCGDDSDRAQRDQNVERVLNSLQ